MENYFDIALTDDQIRGISSIGLAHMGDAVFEILVRGWLCAHGKATGKGMHQATIKLVCAESQATKADRILPILTEEELAVFKRGRNAKAVTRAKNASMSEYRRATGFEALMGYLYLKGDVERMIRLISMGVEKAEVTL